MALFENFPYTDLHNLNLDWIVKIAKDFMEQYSSIQETISTGLEDIDNKATEINNLLDQWYETHSNDIAEQLANALTNINSTLLSALATFETDANTIVNNRIASIPADYTDLTNDVQMLKNSPADLFSLLSELNYNTNYAMAAMMNETAYGITITNESNVFTVNGTATGAVAFSIFNSRTKAYQFPFKWGRTYNINFKEPDNSTPITKVVRYKATESSAWSTQTSNANLNDAFTIVLPNSCYEFAVDLVISSGATYSNKTIEMTIQNRINKLRQFDNTMLNGIMNGKVFFNDMSPVKNTISPSFSGLAITNDGYNIHAQGSCSANRAYELIRDYGADLIKENSMLKVVYDSDNSNATFEVKYRTTGSDVALLQTSTKGTYFVELPDGVTQTIIDIVFFSGTTYNADIYYEVSSVPNENNTFFVKKDGSGDFTTIKSAVETACKLLNSTVIVESGSYNLVTEFGKTFLDGLSASQNYYGMMLYNGIHLIFSPLADVTFDYDGTNTWIIQNFSPFNTGNKIGFTIEGLVINARNCRYIIHDDPRPGNKTNHSKNVYKNCFFSMFPSPNFESWKNHQIIGGGFGDATEIEINSCVFRDIFTDDVDYYSAISYHNSTSGSDSYKSTLVIKNCVFYPKNRIALEGYGDSAIKSLALISGNVLQNATTDIVYDNTVDNILVYKWNNQNL